MTARAVEPRESTRTDVNESARTILPSQLAETYASHIPKYRYFIPSANQICTCVQVPCLDGCLTSKCARLSWLKRSECARSKGKRRDRLPFPLPSETITVRETHSPKRCHCHRHPWKHTYPEKSQNAPPPNRPPHCVSRSRPGRCPPGQSLSPPSTPSVN